MALGTPLLEETRTIGVALETTKGTEVAGATAIRVFDLQGPDSEAEYEERNGTGLYVGNDIGGILGPEIGKLTFTAELRGTGSNGCETGLAALLQACGLAKASEVYCVYSAWASQKCVSIDVNDGGKLKTLYGAAGNVKIRGEAGRRVFLDFEFTGKYKAEEDVALAAYAPSTQVPMKVDEATITLAASNKFISSFELDLQNEVLPFYDTSAPGGILHFYVGNNNPYLTCDPLDPLVADWGIDALRRARTGIAGSLAFDNGTDSVTIALPVLQIATAKSVAKDKFMRRELSMQCLHSSGNDAVKITFGAAT